MSFWVFLPGGPASPAGAVRAPGSGYPALSFVAGFLPLEASMRAQGDFVLAAGGPEYEDKGRLRGSRSFFGSGTSEAQKALSHEELT